jgi:hypothetical protein
MDGLAGGLIGHHKGLANIHTDALGNAGAQHPDKTGNKL